MSVRRRLIAILVVFVAVSTYELFFAVPPGPRSLRVFDADRMADLEIDMWQAYYRRENIRLFADLVTSLHEQNRYPWSRAALAGFYLARAAARFASMRSDYDRVLPDLERAYTIAKNWTRTSFDPLAVARAELAWWVARRLPGHDSAEQVGALIADENALLYEVPRARVLDAATLRARAAKLRDDGGDHADWPAVSALLHESYRGLARAIAY
jgi:hypothetical protein